MVAPTRAPQVRGVKCDLCKKILALATWLDQTKLAKDIEEATVVLNLFKQHDKSECPCIPKNIQNLLVGSTHFEIHRLTATSLDAQIHKKQNEHFISVRHKASKETTRNKQEHINDCKDTRGFSRFKLFQIQSDKKHKELIELQLKHLMNSIDYWKLAMEDQTSPFNPKLALRLGLTHHVIYSCYLFKYYKLLDYQLLTANLLLNLFKTIDSVTLNAILHAHFLLIRSLVDCNQIQAARHCLKQAIKIPNFHDKSNYESILLTCVSCELGIMEKGDFQECIDQLINLTKVNPEDKLQHYYARTLAASILIKYIHLYPERSDLCMEFCYTFRYMCAIIRRCYENSFELVLSEKDGKQSLNGSTPQDHKSQTHQILDHNWIKFAISDFVFSTFYVIYRFYARAGMPENLELLYNGLNLIAHRNGSCYWQAQMIAIGAELDLLCDKDTNCKSKLDAMAGIICNTNDEYLMNLLRLNLEVGALYLSAFQRMPVKKEIVMDMLQRIKTCWESLTSRISKLELLDVKLNSSFKITTNTDTENNQLVFGNELGALGLNVLKASVISLVQSGDMRSARSLIDFLTNKLDTVNNKLLQYNEIHTIIEILFAITDTDKIEHLLIESVGLSQLFMKPEDKTGKLTSQLSRLTINGDSEASSQTRLTRTKNRKSKLSFSCPYAQRATYEVAKSNESISMKTYDLTEALKNFSTLTNEDLALTYLRMSVPNPDYLLYRRAHELLFCYYLKEKEKGIKSSDQLLYHFCESASSNTMRYRWMMFEEQQTGLSASPDLTKSGNIKKHLGFSGNVSDVERCIRSFTRSIPEDYRLVQLKYHYDKDSHKEHLLGVRVERDNEPVYIHAERSISSDDFFEDANVQGADLHRLSLPEKLTTKIEEAKQTLFMSNQKSRNEKREKLEAEVGLILHDIENEWLGPFRFILCGKIIDKEYIKLVDSICNDILLIMKQSSCSSEVGLRAIIEYAPFLDRTEFCQALSSLFNCSAPSKEIRRCFDSWSKSFIDYLEPNQTKMSYILKLKRSQVGLILDKNLEHMPFETLPISRVIGQCVFRVPSLRLFSILRSIHGSSTVINPDETSFILDPANNLGKTRDRFESKLMSHKKWQGIVAQAPKSDLLEQWLAIKDLYLFIGHGAGTIYYNKLCKGRGLSAMASVKSVSIVMGCSSGKVLAEGPRLETFGIGWLFILKGCPSYLGLLWDVTDTDIDKFLDSMLEKWLGNYWLNEAPAALKDLQQYAHLTEATAQARLVCRFKFLVGATPMVYGLPVECKPTT